MVNVTLTASDFCENVPPNFRKINTFEVGSNSMKRKFNIFKSLSRKEILSEKMNIFQKQVKSVLNIDCLIFIPERSSNWISVEEIIRHFVTDHYFYFLKFHLWK